MDFIVKKTTELSKEEIRQINRLFNNVFGKSRSDTEFINQSVNNPLGYSYHSLMAEDGVIVGLNSFVPSFYIVNGERMLFANSTDSMVSKPYRDFFNFSDMLAAGFRKMKEEGVCYIYGYPNDNSYPVLTRSKIYRDIGKMHTYCLPLHVGGIKPALKFLNPVSSLLCRAFVTVSGFFASSRADNYAIHKDEATYNATRYKRGDGRYFTSTLGNVTVWYKIKEHEGVRTAFIIDISEKSPRMFNRAVRHIVRNHAGEFDVLLYPGWLNFRNTSMIRIPRRFEPKNFNFTGKVLNRKAFDDSVWDIRNWDTNLSNYDLI